MVIQILFWFGEKVDQCSNIHYADEIFIRDKRFHYEPIDEGDAIVISCKESRDFLKDVGISGEILSTMSHSEDSISLVLDNGICIVGDLEPVEYLGAYEENVKKRKWKSPYNIVGGLVNYTLYS